VIPAIDVLGDEAVRLERGAYDRVVLRAGDPEALARRFGAAGASLVHVVDLDGARSGRMRPDVVARLVEAARPAAVQASGGIRSLADAERLLVAGAARVVVGTAAFASADALPGLAQALGDRLVVALDVRGGRIAVAGWTRDAGLTLAEAAERCADAGAARLLCTAVERDGTLAGPDLALLTEAREASGLPVLAAGGIASAEDVAAVAAAGCEGAVVGRALLDGARSNLSAWTSAASRASRRTHSPRSTG
jgi:phosphoribosylformimino-5-aminoimidazole carboxamide ribotide isomerase